jgi:hypothetical protein
MHSMKHGLGRRCAALAGVAALLICSAPVAGAQPVMDGNGTLGLSLAELGGSDSLTFELFADAKTAALSFRIPSGMTPVSFVAKVDVAAPLRFSALTVSQGPRVLARQALPTGQEAELDIPLPGVEAFGGWTTLTFELMATPVEDSCSTTVRLDSAAITFSGTDRRPTAVADFLPSVLRRVTIGLPGEPTAAESDAAVQLAAVLARRYGGQSPDIVLERMPGDRRRPADLSPSPAPLLERRIVLLEGREKGLALQGDVLIISGPPGELTGQARLLADETLRFAQSPKVDVEQLAADQIFAPPNVTLAQLGVSVPGRGTQARFTVDQTLFGRPLSGIELRLQGSHTPLPRDVGGEVVVEADSTVIDRWQAQESGVIDRRIRLPRSVIERAMEIKVTVAASSQTNIRGCDSALIADLRLSPATTIATTQTGPPIPEGFQSLPQGLMPVVKIGLNSTTLADTVRAARIAVGLQRSSGVPLITSVTTLRQAVDSNESAVLVAPNGLSEASIGLPFRVDQTQVTVQPNSADEETRTLTLNPAAGFGSLQTVFDGRRSLLVATSNGMPDRLDALLDWLDAERGRWSGLEGRALITVPDSDPVTIPIPDVAEEPEPEPSSRPLLSRGGWIPWAVGSVVALAAAGALTALVRIRRIKARTPAIAAPDDDESPSVEQP